MGDDFSVPFILSWLIAIAYLNNFYSFGWIIVLFSLLVFFFCFIFFTIFFSTCNFSPFQITKSPVSEFICKVFLSVRFCISFLFFFLV